PGSWRRSGIHRMIQTLEIHNFKSIRHLVLDCRRVNVFIGEPNTGKSNILEAVGVFSVPFTGCFRDFIRMENMADVFCDSRLEETVRRRGMVLEESLNVHFNA
ncbi:MAG: AAA family ATPase, partial [Anaerolineae bacterium]